MRRLLPPDDKPSAEEAFSEFMEVVAPEHAGRIRETYEAINARLPAGLKEPTLREWIKFATDDDLRTLSQSSVDDPAE